jgi:hypothetical protein
VVAAFIYKVICRFAEFVVLRLRADVDKDVEILVLRHQLTVLRRQLGKVRTEPAARAVPALLSRLLSRTRWPAFFVTPGTLLRWYRDMVRRRWTCPARRGGRPPTLTAVRALVLRLAADTHCGGRRRPSVSGTGVEMRRAEPGSVADNGPVAEERHGKKNGRIVLGMEPYLITGAVCRERALTTSVAQIAVGALPAVCEILVLGDLLDTWALVVAVLIWVVVAKSLKGANLLMLAAECYGRVGSPYKLKYPGECGARHARNLRPGSWICNADEYDRRAAETKQQDHQEKPRVEWGRQAKQGNREPRRRGQARSGGARPAPEPRSPESRRQPQIPKVKLHQVIAVEQKVDGNMVFAMFGKRGPWTPRSDESFYFVSPEQSTKKGAVLAGRALSDLMAALQQHTDEQMVTRHVVDAGHNERVVRQALRGALKYGMVRRHRSLRSWAREAIAVFQNPASSPRGHQIEVTRVGEIWTKGNEPGSDSD